MPALLHHRLRQLRRGLWYAAAIALVGMALSAAVVSQLLPLAQRHPDHVAAWLSQRLGRPVAFDRVETQWTRRGPLLRLDALRVGEGDKAIRIGDAEMLVAQYAGLLPGRSFTELRLHGLELTLERADDGRWSVRGLPGQQRAGGDPFAALEGLGELQVIGGKLTLLAPQLQIRAHLPKVDVRLRVDGDRVRAGMRAWMQVGRSPLVAVADFGRAQGNGRAYVAASRADLSVWSPLLHVAGIQAESGRGHGEAWAQLRDHRIAMVAVDTTLAGVGLRGAALADGSQPRVGFAHLSMRADLRMTPDGWRLDAPRLRLGAAGRGAQVLDGLVLAGGRRYALLADQVDLGPLLAVAGLSDRLAPGLRQWISVAKPRGLGHDIRFSAGRDGRVRADARLAGVGFAPVDGAPGVQGLGARLRGDAQGLAVTLDGQAPVRLDWPRGFGVPHVVRLDGTMVGWREGAGWRVETPGLRVLGDGYGATVRGGLWFQGDGTRPRIDLAAQVDPARIAVAKRFWIRSLMSPATIGWLDDALVDGRIEGARAVVSGDLDDWPFREQQGRFEATATVRDATLRYLPDWPAAEHLDGELRFVADGLDVTGKGVVAGVGVRRFEAAIPHLGAARLAVHAQGGGDASRLLGLLRQSPLQASYGDTLDNLAASGLAAVTFDLDLPLHDTGTSRLGGTVTLAGAKLADRRWDLAFGNVRGRARYDRDGFVAEQLAVRYADRPGRLSLRAGNHTRDRTQGFEAELDATLPANELLQRAPQLAWLQPHISGASPWSIAVTIPKAATASRTASADTARLRLRSSLVGTALTLPAPLDKPAAERLATTVETRLPLERGEIAVAFGTRLALRARSDARGTGVRVQLGSDRVAEAPPVSGLVASGRATHLDALDWAMLASGNDDDDDDAKPSSGAAADTGLALRDIDVVADHLQLLGADFPGIRVRASPVADATRLQFNGASLAGTVRLPQARGAAINGRLQRLHWRAAGGKDAGAPASRAEPAAAASDDVDPSRVPPLELTVDDLRFADAVLGSASLRTHPTAAGLQIEQLQTRAPGQRIDVTGDWSGRPGATRTHLGMTIQSDDFGDLLAGFGYGGQVARGHGRAILDAAWAGGPAGFRLDVVDGSLQLDVRDGQLTELEPGAGRVLGLLSVAQLPRRLTLDFRDFFSKGFAFDRVSGSVGLDGGQARTDDLVINGPAARIEIHGAANLRAQTFDQTILVLPKTGNLLTAVGAIAGGPVGAAIGAAANAMLKKPLGELAAKTYHVSGPWKDPKVEVTSREPPRAETAANAPAG